MLITSKNQPDYTQISVWPDNWSSQVSLFTQKVNYHKFNLLFISFYQSCFFLSHLKSLCLLIGPTIFCGFFSWKFYTLSVGNFEIVFAYNIRLKLRFCFFFFLPIDVQFLKHYLLDNSNTELILHFCPKSVDHICLEFVLQKHFFVTCFYLFLCLNIRAWNCWIIGYIGI